MERGYLQLPTVDSLPIVSPTLVQIFVQMAV